MPGLTREQYYDEVIGRPLTGAELHPLQREAETALQHPRVGMKAMEIAVDEELGAVPTVLGPPEPPEPEPDTDPDAMQLTDPEPEPDVEKPAIEPSKWVAMSADERREWILENATSYSQLLSWLTASKTAPPMTARLKQRRIRRVRPATGRDETGTSGVTDGDDSDDEIDPARQVLFTPAKLARSKNNSELSEEERWLLNDGSLDTDDVPLALTSLSKENMSNPTVRAFLYTPGIRLYDEGDREVALHRIFDFTQARRDFDNFSQLPVVRQGVRKPESMTEEMWSALSPTGQVLLQDIEDVSDDALYYFASVAEREKQANFGTREKRAENEATIREILQQVPNEKDRAGLLAQYGMLVAMTLSATSTVELSDMALRYIEYADYLKKHHNIDLPAFELGEQEKPSGVDEEEDDEGF